MHAKYLPCDYNTDWGLALAVEDRTGWFCVIFLLDVCSPLIMHAKYLPCDYNTDWDLAVRYPHHTLPFQNHA